MRLSSAGQGSDRIGRYELIERLGVGGMAEVFKARIAGPAGFDRSVVIKRIHPEHCDDPEFVGMFAAEARSLGLLHHPNIVETYDFGEADGLPFLVLELVEGPSLRRVMNRLAAAKQRMPPTIAAHFAHQICRALDYVHTLRDRDGAPLDIIHRDVTPSNIHLTSTGGIKLLDFGVARCGRSEVRTRHRVVKGKPAYLAPEAIEGKAIDARVDIFALGIVLHELLTLTNLFAAPDELITLRRALTKQIQPPSRSHPDVPPALDAIVLKALSRDLDQRYASANQMARDLDELVLSSRLSADGVARFARDMMDGVPVAPVTSTPASLETEAITACLAPQAPLGACPDFVIAGVGKMRTGYALVAPATETGGPSREGRAGTGNA